MIISLLAAIGKNNELGANNRLLWDIKDDVKLFKEISMGHSIIMGRKTFESLDMALPGRNNIVVSRLHKEIEGAYAVSDLEAAFDMVRNRGEAEAVVIGGGEVFEEVIDRADKMYLSHVNGYFPDADVFFPKIDYDDWEVIEAISFPKNERNEFDFEFKVYVRKLRIKN